MRKIFISLLLLVAFNGTGTAQEMYPEEVISEDVYIFPRIAPEVAVSAGYRFVNLNGSESASEYEYLGNSFSLATDLRVFSFPHRFHLDIDIKNKKDYFGDVSYAFKDIILFRGINRTLFHNLDNLRLLDLNTATLSPGVDVRDADRKYGIKTGINNIFLRFKTPDFPFHVYIDGSLLEKDGAQQLRSLLGSGYFNNIIRTSQKINVDLKTKNILIGVNTHLGPLEVDISHGEKRFDVSGDKVIYDIYSPAGSPPGTTRSGGVFPHNLIPEIRSSSNTFKIHTSYTGSLVVSATFSKVDKENKDSRAKADYFIGEGEVTWIPLPKLAIFLKYRHRETDIDNPDSVTITDKYDPLNTYTYLVRQPISSENDTVSGIVRYRPVSGLTLKAEYSYENIRRENADEWNLPESTQKNVISFSTDARIFKGLNLKARYTHKKNSNPAYNMEPDRSDEGRISVSWITLQKINTLLSYNIAKEIRRDLRFIDTANDMFTEGPNKRSVMRDRLLGSVTFLVMKDLSLTTSYAYIHNKTEQDIVFHSGNPPYPELLDPLVPHKDKAHNYSVDINYMLKNNINFSTAISHTISRGTFYPAGKDLIEPVSIASFSETKIKETDFSVSGEYRFKGNFRLGLSYKYGNLKDMTNNPYDAIKDGTVKIILLSLSKRW